MKIIDSILTDVASIAAIRKDIHAHPELCFQEERTADVIAKQLTDWGIPIHRGMGTTGVIGILTGRDGGACGRGIGLRADIDALPMQEFNTFAHASKYQSKMHACGHDGHTAMLLQRPNISPNTATLMARFIRSSNPPKKAAAAPAR